MRYTPFNHYWRVAATDQIYGSAKAAPVAENARAFAEWQAAGGIPTVIADMPSLVEVLRAAAVPPYHKVPTAVIVDRLIEVGRLDAANAALESVPSLKARFYTRAHVFGDNAEARAFLAAIGVDPDAILAPTTAEVDSAFR